MTARRARAFIVLAGNYGKTVLSTRANVMEQKKGGWLFRAALARIEVVLDSRIFLHKSLI